MNYIIDDICAYLRNWFLSPADVHEGAYTVIDGEIALPFLAPGQFYKIVGSVFNDGVHRYKDADDTLTDEAFTGAVWALSLPPALLSMAEEIEKWTEDNAAALTSPYQSESFGGYSYTKASGSDGALSWKDVFAPRLARWRKI